uniref:Transmembrane protein 231 n=1 Tax=Steinernema glaseri TaxID=37863 RepID=A0A1I8A9P5_9BILA
MSRDDGVVHEEIIVRKYHGASPWAHLFHTLIYVTTLVLPLIIAFLTQGFWRKVELYREQPIVDFDGKSIMLIRGSRENEYVVWSSFHALNEAVESHLSVPLIEKQKFDWDDDGRVDKISIYAEFANVQFPVHSVVWVILLQYRLDQHFLVEVGALVIL